MKRLSVVLMLLTIAIPIAAQRQKLSIFEVRRPTILAFFPPVTQAEMDRDPDINEALADSGVCPTGKRTAPPEGYRVS